MIEYFLALALGIVVGTITGLFPGIHINLVAAFILVYLEKLLSLPFVSPLSLSIFIVSMSIIHTFLDFIPSIFLGAPEEDTFLSILPGHEMLMKGKGQEAVILTLYGSILAIPIILVFSPLFIILLPAFFSAIKSAVPYILIFISFYLMIREDKPLIALTIFFLSGFLGLSAFNLPVKEPLLPLLSGLFGLSGLLISMNNKIKIKIQEKATLSSTKLPKKEFFRAIYAALISAPFCSFLPGIGAGHAAVIGSEILPQKRKGFLVLVGSLNTIIMGLSFVTAFSINKTRTGSAAAVSQILDKITLNNLYSILAIVIITAIIAFFLGYALSSIFSRLMNKVNYKFLTLSVILIIIVVNIVFSNFLGLIVLITGTAIGMFTISSSSRRINLMGSLLLPSIFFYLIY